MAPVYAAFGIGTALGPAIGGVLGAAYGLNAPFMFVGSAMISAAALNFLTVRETRPAKQGCGRSVSDQGAEGVQLSPSISPPTPASHEASSIPNTTTPSCHSSATSVGASDVQSVSDVSTRSARTAWEEMKETAQQWRAIMSLESVRALLTLNTSFWMVHTGSQMGIVPFLLTDTLGFSVYDLGALFAMTSIINVVFSQPVAWIADRFGRKSTMLPGVSIVCLCLAALPYIHTAESMVALQALWSLGACLLGTSPLAYAVDATPSHVRAQTMAMVRSSGDLGLLLGGAVLGSLLQTLSLQTTTGLAAGVLAASGLYFFRKAPWDTPLKS